MEYKGKTQLHKFALFFVWKGLDFAISIPKLIYGQTIAATDFHFTLFIF